MTHVARHPLVAPLMKFQNTEGVAGLGWAEVTTTLGSIGDAGRSVYATRFS
jgi:hypothetical protein